MMPLPAQISRAEIYREEHKISSKGQSTVRERRAVCAYEDNDKLRDLIHSGRRLAGERRRLRAWRLCRLDAR
jgi:hypothetical protein